MQCLMLWVFNYLLPLCWFLSYWFDWLVSAISAIRQLRWGSIGGYVSHVHAPLSLANLRDQPSGPRAPGPPFLRAFVGVGVCHGAASVPLGTPDYLLCSPPLVFSSILLLYPLYPLFSFSVLLLCCPPTLFSSPHSLLHSPPFSRRSPSLFVSPLAMLHSWHGPDIKEVRSSVCQSKAWAKSTPMQRPSPF